MTEYNIADDDTRGKMTIIQLINQEAHTIHPLLKEQYGQYRNELLRKLKGLPDYFYNEIVQLYISNGERHILELCLNTNDVQSIDRQQLPEIIARVTEFSTERIR